MNKFICMLISCTTLISCVMEPETPIRGFSANSKINEQYAMDCTRTRADIDGRLYRCENIEVVCYAAAYEGGIFCKFKDSSK